MEELLRDIIEESNEQQELIIEVLGEEYLGD